MIAGDGNEVDVGTAVVTEGHGHWGMTEEISPGRDNAVMVRFPEGDAAWFAAADLNVAADQSWRPKGWRE